MYDWTDGYSHYNFPRMLIRMLLPAWRTNLKHHHKFTAGISYKT